MCAIYGMPTITVTLPHTKYDVKVEDKSLLSLAKSLAKAGLDGKKCAIITDSNVAEHHLTSLTDLLDKAKIVHSANIIPAGEKSKSISIAAEICSDMVLEGHDRQSFVLALGGGVVGDLAGFIASIFFRGIPFVQIPTTIVSQVDSSVGGKTGVNTPEGKNLIGVFKQPALVIIDPLLLKTLPKREYLEGYAEVIKHACIRDANMLKELEELDLEKMPPPAKLLARNVEIKARVVEEDEKETTGTRALLNFGHTIGHAIEASVPYGELLHGEAISLGIRAALYLSVKHSGLKQRDANRIVKLLERYSLPIVLPTEISTEKVLEKMKTDKKFSQGEINFVLLDKLGSAHVSSELSLEDIEDAIEEIRTYFFPTAKPGDDQDIPPLSIIRYVGGMVSTNGYLLYTGEHYLAVDAPYGFFDYLKEEGITPKALLLTHQHYDHVEDAHKFEKAGIPIYSYAPYSKKLIMVDLAKKWGLDVVVKPYKVDHVLKGKDMIDIGGSSICIIHVPGHSDDSIVFYFPGKVLLFAGDTLFNSSIGRSDLPGGDGDLLIKGIAEKILVLNKGIQIFPGHGDGTYILKERLNNPFFSDLDIQTEDNITNETQPYQD